MGISRQVRQDLKARAEVELGQLNDLIMKRLKELLTPAERLAYADYVRELARGGTPTPSAELEAAAMKIRQDRLPAEWGEQFRQIILAFEGVDCGPWPPTPMPKAGRAGRSR